MAAVVGFFINITETDNRGKPMKRVITAAIATLLMSILLPAALTGCTEPAPPPPPENQPPPPPTADEIYREIKPKIQPLWRAMGGGPKLTETDAEQVVNDLRPLKAKHTATENGQEALGRIEDDIADLVRQARDQEKWGTILGGIMAYEVLQPGNERFARLKERAELMSTIPAVFVRGFVRVEEEEYVFLEVIDSKANLSETYKVREQEEFHEVLRLVRIIGNNQKVEILYIPANYTFEVSGPRDT
jgi:hypothetical protein